MSTKQIKKSIELLQELVDANNPLIYKLIESEKSHDITEIVAKKYSPIFHKLVNDFSEKSSIEQCFNLFNYIGVDPLRFVNLTRKKFQIELADKAIEDIEYFLNFSNTKIDGINFKFPLEFIEEMTCNNSVKLLSIWSDEETKDSDKFRLIWVKGNQYLRSQLVQGSKLKDDNNTSTLDLLKHLKPHGLNLMEDWYYINNQYCNSRSIKSILDMASYVEVQELHDELSKTINKETKRIKI